jgi:hypothetical protein
MPLKPFANKYTRYNNPLTSRLDNPNIIAIELKTFRPVLQIDTQFNAELFRIVSHSLSSSSSMAERCTTPVPSAIRINHKRSPFKDGGHTEFFTDGCDPKRQRCLSSTEPIVVKIEAKEEEPPQPPSCFDAPNGLLDTNLHRFDFEDDDGDVSTSSSSSSSVSPQHDAGVSPIRHSFSISRTRLTYSDAPATGRLSFSFDKPSFPVVPPVVKIEPLPEVKRPSRPWVIALTGHAHSGVGEAFNMIANDPIISQYVRCINLTDRIKKLLSDYKHGDGIKIAWEDVKTAVCAMWYEAILSSVRGPCVILGPILIRSSYIRRDDRDDRKFNAILLSVRKRAKLLNINLEVYAFHSPFEHVAQRCKALFTKGVCDDEDDDNDAVTTTEDPSHILANTYMQRAIVDTKYCKHGRIGYDELMNIIRSRVHKLIA